MTTASVAWLSLDASDNEPASFWTYVVSALQGAVPGVGSSALELHRLLAVPTDLVLTTLLNELAAAPGEVWLVLDDYHLVDSTDIGHGMTFLLDHLPPHVHVVLSTRADPDLPLARWRARGELVEIRAADLRFTPDEAASYLNEATGLRLAASDVEALEERTEGWIAALQLAALSIQGRDDASGFIARFAGNDRYIVDYLVEEVLQHQPEPVREFLLRSAVLDRLTGPLCDAVTGGDDGSAHARRPWSGPTSSSSPWTTSGSGIATTICSPTCCGRACSPSSPTWFRCCTSEPAAGTRRTTWPRRRSGTRWLRGTSTGRPTSSSWRCRRSDVTGRKPCCSAG